MTELLLEVFSQSVLSASTAERSWPKYCDMSFTEAIFKI